MTNEILSRLVEETLNDMYCPEVNLFPFTARTPLAIRFGTASPPVRRLHNLVHMLQARIENSSELARVEQLRNCQQEAIAKIDELIATSLHPKLAAQCSTYELDADWNIIGIRHHVPTPSTPPVKRTIAGCNLSDRLKLTTATMQ